MTSDVMINGMTREEFNERYAEAQRKGSAAYVFNEQLRNQNPAKLAAEQSSKPVKVPA
jgi:hypothetical protein